MDLLPHRPGWRTAELWASMAFGGSGVGLIVWGASGGFRPGVEVPVIVAGAALALGSLLGYLWTRTQVKRSEHDANGNINAAVASSRSRSV